MLNVHGSCSFGLNNLCAFPGYYFFLLLFPDTFRPITIRRYDFKTKERLVKKKKI